MQLDKQLLLKILFLTSVLNRNDFTFPLNFRRRWPLAANVNIYFTLPAPMRLLIAGDVQQILYVFYAKAKKVITVDSAHVAY